MMRAGNAPRRRSPWTVVIAAAVVLGAVVYLLEQASDDLIDKQARDGSIPTEDRWLVPIVNLYLAARHHVMRRWYVYFLLVPFGAVALYVGLKRWSAWVNKWRDEMTGMAFKQESYALAERGFDLRTAIVENPDPDHQVALGADEQGRTVYLDDTARSMHTQLLGQTGSGKTKGVIEPLLFQDLCRGRGVLVVDGKGSQENEDGFAAMANMAGRLDDVKIFTLNPSRRSHTYNPIHLVPDADPQAVAERVFGSFVGDMEHPYYRDQSRMLFVSLVRALASTGQPFTMRDCAAAIADREVLAHALGLASDRAAVGEIETQFHQLGRTGPETFTGLLAAVRRYDHPSLNSADPDIVLENEIEEGRATAFYLPANYYKQLARYVGVGVLQHLQQIGAIRQLDRSRSQRPVYVYADEFYTFAYEGFTDAVNKLRDAHIALLLGHQTFSDLEKVSRAFADGVWDNTRNKIILYQNHPDTCDRIAKALGTVKDVELTVRRSVDGFWNQVSAHEASSREVDAYRCHPNRIKCLRRGQGYLAQDATFVGLNFAVLPEFPAATPPAPRVSRRDGLGLHELFVKKRDRK